MTGPNTIAEQSSRTLERVGDDGQCDGDGRGLVYGQDGDDADGSG